jgi:hypothetical protein
VGCIYVCGVYVHMYVYGGVCRGVGMYVLMCVGVYVGLWGCMYVCGGVWMCVGMYACVCK